MNENLIVFVCIIFRFVLVSISVCRLSYDEFEKCYNPFVLYIGYSVIRLRFLCCFLLCRLVAHPLTYLCIALTKARMQISRDFSR